MASSLPALVERDDARAAVAVEPRGVIVHHLAPLLDSRCDGDTRLRAHSDCARAPPRPVPSDTSSATSPQIILEHRFANRAASPRRCPPSPASRRSWRRRSASRRAQEKRCRRSSPLLMLEDFERGRRQRHDMLLGQPSSARAGSSIDACSQSISSHCAPNASLGRDARQDHETPRRKGGVALEPRP